MAPTILHRHYRNQLNASTCLIFVANRNFLYTKGNCDYWFLHMVGTVNTTLTLTSVSENPNTDKALVTVM